MKYPEWWQRLLAGLIDGLILAIGYMIIIAIFTAVAGFSLTALRIMLLLATLIYTAAVVGYKVFFESSPMQATPGKMAFGLKVADESGNRAALKPVLMRTWPWWLYLLGVLDALLLINIFSLLAATFRPKPSSVKHSRHQQTPNPRNRSSQRPIFNVAFDVR